MTAYFVLTVQAKCPWAPCASATEIKQSVAADFWGAIRQVLVYYSP